MMENPLNLSLNQGQKFNKFQNKIKKTVLEHKNIKEGFNIQQQNIIEPTTDISYPFTDEYNNIKNEDKQIVVKINNMKKRYNNLVNQYNKEIQNIENILSINNNANINSNINIIDNLNKQLIILGNNITSEIKTLYINNYKIYQLINNDSEKFNNDVKMYNNINIRIQKLNKEGMQNMSAQDINSLVNDSNIYILYENYNYVLWGILAITTLTITMKLLK